MPIFFSLCRFSRRSLLGILCLTSFHSVAGTLPGPAEVSPTPTLGADALVEFFEGSVFVMHSRLRSQPEGFMIGGSQRTKSFEIVAPPREFYGRNYKAYVMTGGGERLVITQTESKGTERTYLERFGNDPRSLFESHGPSQFFDIGNREQMVFWKNAEGVPHITAIDVSEAVLTTHPLLQGAWHDSQRFGDIQTIDPQSKNQFVALTDNFLLVYDLFEGKARVRSEGELSELQSLIQKHFSEDVEVKVRMDSVMYSGVRGWVGFSVQAAGRGRSHYVVPFQRDRNELKVDVLRVLNVGSFVRFLDVSPLGELIFLEPAGPNNPAPGFVSTVSPVHRGLVRLYSVDLDSLGQNFKNFKPEISWLSRGAEALRKLSRQGAPQNELVSNSYTLDYPRLQFYPNGRSLVSGEDRLSPDHGLLALATLSRGTLILGRDLATYSVEDFFARLYMVLLAIRKGVPLKSGPLSSMPFELMLSKIYAKTPNEHPGITDVRRKAQEEFSQIFRLASVTAEELAKAFNTDAILRAAISRGWGIRAGLSFDLVGVVRLSGDGSEMIEWVPSPNEEDLEIRLSKVASALHGFQSAKLQAAKQSSGELVSQGRSCGASLSVIPGGKK